MNEHKKHGSSFSSKMGFILAAAGSAVGLGNLWRFPYLAAKYGGGSFLLIYVILAVTFGFALMITEIALGRKTGKSALYAFSTLHEKCGFIGILASIVPIIILPYYCVIGGRVTTNTAIITERTTRSGISTLLIFSIPLFTPSRITTEVARIKITSHITGSPVFAIKFEK